MMAIYKILKGIEFCESIILNRNQNNYFNNSKGIEFLNERVNSSTIA